MELLSKHVKKGKRYMVVKRIIITTKRFFFYDKKNLVLVSISGIT